MLSSDCEWLETGRVKRAGGEVKGRRRERERKDEWEWRWGERGDGAAALRALGWQTGSRVYYAYEWGGGDTLSPSVCPHLSHTYWCPSGQSEVPAPYLGVDVSARFFWQQRRSAQLAEHRKRYRGAGWAAGVLIWQWDMGVGGGAYFIFFWKHSFPIQLLFSSIGGELLAAAFWEKKKNLENLKTFRNLRGKKKGGGLEGQGSSVF